MEEKELLQEQTLTEQNGETSQQEVAQQSDSDRNFAELREQKNRVERERNEFKARMEAMEIAQKKQSESKPQQPSLADDDLVEWKYVKQEIDGLKNEIKSYKQTSSAAAAESRLKAKYTDFDSVVTQSNIERLREQHPEIAQTLSSNQDLYSQASATYDIIKQYGIYNPDVYKQDKERVQQNASKPRSVNAASGQRGESPLDNASAFAEGLTADLKKQLYKEMQEAIKRR